MESNINMRGSTGFYVKWCLSFDEFKEAIERLVDELYSEKYETEYIDQLIEKFAIKADAIASYAFDTKNT